MTRDVLLRQLIERDYLRSLPLIEAFKKVDRKDFLPSIEEAHAYENEALSIGFGQIIPRPSIVAFMLELLNPLPGERILEVGTGLGWFTALLAFAVKTSQPGARFPLVISMERILPLAEAAEKNLEHYGLVKKGIVKVVAEDGSHGCERYAPYDRIITGATAGVIPVKWKNQLCMGGRIVAPVETTIEVQDKLSPSDYNVRMYHGFTFVPLVEDRGGDSQGD